MPPNCCRRWSIAEGRWRSFRLARRATNRCLACDGTTGSTTRRPTVETWRSDEDLLARTLSGAALPVGQLDIRRYCTLVGEFTALATLHGGAPLVARVPTEHGGAYFWTTTPAPADSSLAAGGVVLYAFIQRSLAAGAAMLGKTRQLDAGTATAAELGRLDAPGGRHRRSFERSPVSTRRLSQWRRAVGRQCGCRRKHGPAA